jgi:hypothetical protein
MKKELHLMGQFGFKDEYHSSSNEVVSIAVLYKSER